MGSGSRCTWGAQLLGRGSPILVVGVSGPGQTLTDFMPLPGRAADQNRPNGDGNACLATASFHEFPLLEAHSLRAWKKTPEWCVITCAG